MEQQMSLNVETPQYTEDQQKSARDALFMWAALPCNPVAVAGSLHRAIQAEFHATGSMADVGPAALIINGALQGIFKGDNGFIDMDSSVLFKAVDDCRQRVKGTKYDSPHF